MLGMECNPSSQNHTKLELEELVLKICLLTNLFTIFKILISHPLLICGKCATPEHENLIPLANNRYAVWVSMVRRLRHKLQRKGDQGLQGELTL